MIIVIHELKTGTPKENSCYLLSNLVALDVVVYPCQYAQGEYLGQHPCGRIRVRIGAAEMLDEILTRLCKFCVYELLRLRKSAGIIEIRRSGHPKGIPCLTARDVDNSTADGYLNLLDLVEHQQSQMPVETVHVQRLIKRCTSFEYMILFRDGQKRKEISTESVIADVAEIVLRSCHVLYMETTGLQQRYQLCW